jgi:hypothetical protein
MAAQEPPPPQAPWGHLPRSHPLQPSRWGYAPPPAIWVKRRTWDDWKELPFCNMRMMKGLRVRVRPRPRHLDAWVIKWRLHCFKVTRCLTSIARVWWRTELRCLDEMIGQVMDYVAEMLPPLKNGDGLMKENGKNNFWLPKYAERKGYMASKDAMYVGK